MPAIAASGMMKQRMLAHVRDRPAALPAHKPALAWLFQRTDQRYRLAITIAVGLSFAEGADSFADLTMAVPG